MNPRTYHSLRKPFIGPHASLNTQAYFALICVSLRSFADFALIKHIQA
jgi:hypothetical protein